jgi:hypothetical protein
MTCSITNTTTVGSTYSCSDTTNTFAVVAGDRIILKFVESANDGKSYMIGFGTTLVCQ